MNHSIRILLLLGIILSCCPAAMSQTLGEVLRAVQRRNQLRQSMPLESGGTPPVTNIHWVGGIPDMPADSLVNSAGVEAQIKLLRQAWREAGAMNFYDERVMRGDSKILAGTGVQPPVEPINPSNFQYMLKLLAYRVSRMKVLDWPVKVTMRSGYEYWMFYAGRSILTGHDSEGNPTYEDAGAPMPSPIVLSKFQQSEVSDPSAPLLTYGFEATIEVRSLTEWQAVSFSYLHGDILCEAPADFAGKVTLLSNFDYRQINAIPSITTPILREPGMHTLGEVTLAKGAVQGVAAASPLTGVINTFTLTGHWELNSSGTATRWIPEILGKAPAFYDNFPGNLSTVRLGGTAVFTANFDSTGPEFQNLPSWETEEAPPLQITYDFYGMRVNLANAPANECALQWQSPGLGAGAGMRKALVPVGGGNWDAVYSSSTTDREPEIGWSASPAASQDGWPNFDVYMSNWWSPVLTQLVCETYGLNIVQGSGNSYTIKFYRKDQVGPKSGGKYTFTDPPAASWVVAEDPGDKQRMTVSTSGGALYTIGTTDGVTRFTLAEGGSTIYEITSSSDSVTHQTFFQTKLDGRDYPQMTISNGTNTMEIKETGASGIRTTLYTYANEVEDGKTFRRLSSIAQTGGANPYVANYDDAEQLTSYTSSAGADGVTMTYSGSTVTRKEMVLGSAKSTVTTTYSNGFKTASSTLGGVADAATGLVERYPGAAATGLGAGALKTVRGFDGSLTTYTYGNDGDSVVMTEISGRGANKSATSVTVGTKTVTKVNRAGKIYSREVFDVQTNAKLDSWVATAYKAGAPKFPTTFSRLRSPNEIYDYDGTGQLAQFTDGLGKTYAIARDALGRVKQVTRDGVPWTVSYNPASFGTGKLGVKIVAAGRTWEVESDPFGTYKRVEQTGGPDPLQILRVDSGSSVTTTTTASKSGATTSSVTSKNTLATAVSGNAVSVTGAGGEAWNTSYAISATGGWTETVSNSAVGALTGSTTYDALGRVTKTISPSGSGSGTATTNYTYADGLPSTIIDPQGTTSLTYGTGGRLASIVRGDRSLSLSTAGSSSSSLNQTWTNGAGEVIWKTMYAPSTGVITEQPWGLVTKQTKITPSISGDTQTISVATTPANLTQSMSWKDRALQSGSFSQGTVQKSFTATLGSDGLWTSAGSTVGSTTYTMNYSSNAALTGVSGGGYSASFSTPYAGGGKLQASGTVNTRSVLRLYSATGQLLDTTGTYGEADQTWSMPTAGLVSTLTTGAGNMSFTMNAGGTLKQRTFPNGSLESYRYTAAGYLNGWSTPRGPVNLTVNAFGQPLTVSATGVSGAITYDSAGRVSTITDVAGLHDFSYTNGRLTSEGQTGGVFDGEGTGRTYDAAGRLTGETWTSGGSTTFTYGTAAHPTGVTISAGLGAGTNTSGTWSGINPVTGKAGDLTLGPLSVHTDYDTRGRVIGRTNKVAGATLTSTSLTYTNEDCTSLTTEKGSWTLGYNGSGYLSSASRTATPSALAFSYPSDEVGRHSATSDYYPTARTNIAKLLTLGTVTPGATVTVTLDTGAPVPVTVNGTTGAFQGEFAGLIDGWHQVKVKGTLAGAGSGGGNAVSEGSVKVYLPPPSETLNYDAAGNRSSDARWAYTWDMLDRLTSVVETAPAVAGQGLKVEFKYDLLGRRTEKTVSVGAVKQKKVVFQYNGSRLAREIEYSATGAQLAKRTYFWGPDVSGTPEGAAGIGGLLAIHELKGGTLTKNLVLNDGIGNIVGLVDAATGAVKASYEHGMFGEAMDVSGDRSGTSPLRWQSKYYDEETGFYYFGKRYYDPTTQTWLSRDPEREAGGMNQYAYCENRPIGNSDPLGGAVLVQSETQTVAVADSTWWAMSINGFGPDSNIFGTKSLFVQRSDAWMKVLEERRNVEILRAAGMLRMMGGGVEIISGSIYVLSTGGLGGAAGGGPLILNGVDNLQAGYRTRNSGEYTPAFLESAIKSVAGDGMVGNGLYMVTQIGVGATPIAASKFASLTGDAFLPQAYARGAVLVPDRAAIVGSVELPNTRFVSFGNEVGAVTSPAAKMVGAESRAIVVYEPWPTKPFERGGFLGGYSRVETAQEGQILSRIGDLKGSYVSPPGASLGQRGLPSAYPNTTETLWEVVKPFKMDAGLAAPWKDAPGLGIQYRMEQGVQSLWDAGYIRPAGGL